MVSATQRICLTDEMEMDENIFMANFIYHGYNEPNTLHTDFHCVENSLNFLNYAFNETSVSILEILSIFTSLIFNFIFFVPKSV